jgi:hypothetical protein
MKLYGITHSKDNGQPIHRQVKVLKLSIGQPMGPDCLAYIDRAGKWTVESGVYSGGKRESKIETYPDRQAAEKAYANTRKNAGERKYPRKFAHFLFSKLRSDGAYWPDFDAIEAHGAAPSEIDIVFTAAEPLATSMSYYTATELKCTGDGRDARRRVEMAKSDQEKAFAKEAISRGDKFFNIIQGCYAYACEYAHGEAPPCKPHGRLFFQLLNSPRIGGTCTFDTTGFTSIKQLFSCIEDIKSVTGRGDAIRGTVQGIPLKLVLRPYRTNHTVKGERRTSIQYGVSLEMRARTATELMNLLHGYADDFRKAAKLDEPLKQLTAPIIQPETTEEDPAEQQPIIESDDEAPALAAEFYPEEQNPDPEPVEDWEPPAPIQQPRRRSDMSRPVQTPAADKVAKDMDSVYDALKWSPMTRAVAAGLLTKRMMSPSDFQKLMSVPAFKNENDAIAFMSLYGYTSEAPRVLGFPVTMSVEEIVSNVASGLDKPLQDATEQEIVASITRTEEALRK